MTDVLDSPFAPPQGNGVICLIPADDGLLLVTEDRIAISHGKRVTMDLPIVEIRRIQLDIERRRPATFVIVPDSPGTEPEVVAIPAAAYEDVTKASAHIGHVLESLDRE